MLHLSHCRIKNFPQVYVQKRNMARVPCYIATTSSEVAAVKLIDRTRMSQLWGELLTGPMGFDDDTPFLEITGRIRSSIPYGDVTFANVDVSPPDYAWSVPAGTGLLLIPNVQGRKVSLRLYSCNAFESTLCTVAASTLIGSFSTMSQLVMIAYSDRAFDTSRTFNTVSSIEELIDPDGAFRLAKAQNMPSTLYISIDAPLSAPGDDASDDQDTPLQPLSGAPLSTNSITAFVTDDDTLTGITPFVTPDAVLDLLLNTAPASPVGNLLTAVSGLSYVPPVGFKVVYILISNDASFNVQLSSSNEAGDIALPPSSLKMIVVCIIDDPDGTMLQANPTSQPPIQFYQFSTRSTAPATLGIKVLSPGDPGVAHFSGPTVSLSGASPQAPPPPSLFSALPASAWPVLAPTSGDIRSGPLAAPLSAPWSARYSGSTTTTDPPPNKPATKATTPPPLGWRFGCGDLGGGPMLCRATTAPSHDTNEESRPVNKHQRFLSIFVPIMAILSFFGAYILLRPWRKQT